MMQYKPDNPKPRYSDTQDNKVSYEEIMDIVNRRHDYESVGDNDIF